MIKGCLVDINNCQAGLNGIQRGTQRYCGYRLFKTYGTNNNLNAHPSRHVEWKNGASYSVFVWAGKGMFGFSVKGIFSFRQDKDGVTHDS